MAGPHMKSAVILLRSLHAAVHGTSQPVQSLLPIRIISHKRTPLVAARHQVIVDSRVFNPQRLSHNGTGYLDQNARSTLMANEALTPNVCGN